MFVSFDAQYLVSFLKKTSKILFQILKFYFKILFQENCLQLNKFVKMLTKFPLVFHCFFLHRLLSSTFFENESQNVTQQVHFITHIHF